MPSFPYPRIALVTVHDPDDPNGFSGTTHFATRALVSLGLSVEWIGPRRRPSFLRRQWRRVRLRLGIDERTTASALEREARRDGNDLARALARKPYDVVLAFVASAQLAYLETDLPVVYVSDAVFKLLDGFYEAVTAMPEDAKAVLDRFESRSLEKATLVCLGTEWAAEGARRHYGTPDSKLAVVPFGANLSSVPEFKLRTLAPGSRVELLLIAKYNDRTTWERKGGPEAVEAVRLLNEWGVPSRLTILGMKVPGLPDSEVVRSVGFLHKGRPDEYRLFCEIMGGSHLLLLPTRAEASGMATAEAAALGMPVVTRRIGGMTTMVDDGVTGVLVDENAGAAEFAEAVRGVLAVPGRLERMSRASRARFDRVLSWDTWARELAARIVAVTAARAA
jgi:glycosyltransferase involved in cell wall biosynthesis